MTAIEPDYDDDWGWSTDAAVWHANGEGEVPLRPCDIYVGRAADGPIAGAFLASMAAYPGMGVEMPCKQSWVTTTPDGVVSTWIYVLDPGATVTTTVDGRRYDMVYRLAQEIRMGPTGLRFETCEARASLVPSGLRPPLPAGLPCVRL